jgi:hypothetical protein
MSTAICEAIKGDGAPCGKKAKWIANEKRYCGIHVKKFPDRVEIDPKPEKKKKPVKKATLGGEGSGSTSEAGLLNAHQQSVIEAQRENRKKKKPMGTITITVAEGRKMGPLIDGFERIYTDPRNVSKRDGMLVPELHPARIGPIEHDQPTLPPAKNLEVFHRANQVYSETAGKTFHTNQVKAYGEEKPKRAAGKPLVFYMWRVPPNHPKGEVVDFAECKELHLTPLDGREIYSKTYHKMVCRSAAFMDLVRRMELGYNLDIVSVSKMEGSQAECEALYRDLSRPFHYTHVLYMMLLYVSKKAPAEKLPWNKFGKVLPQVE